MPRERSGRASVRDAMPAPILSVSEAAARLPCKDADARRWLRENDLIRDLVGREVVSWREVLKVVESGQPPAAAPSDDLSTPRAPSRRRSTGGRLQPL